MAKPETLILQSCQPVAGAPDQRWLGKLTFPGEKNARELLLIPKADSFVAVPRRCTHEGYDLSHCALNNRGQIVCPLHGRTIETAHRSCESWPAQRTGDGFAIELGNARSAGDESLNVDELRLEIESLRQANAALENELLDNAQTLDSLVETLDSHQRQLRQRTQEIETLNGFMERAIDTMGELFFLLHPDGRIRQANTLAERELGITDRDEYLEDFLRPEDYAAMAAHARPNSHEGLLLGTIRAHGGHYEAELELNHTGASTATPYLLRGGLLHSAAGKLEGAVVIASNIAHLRERERVARENEAMFRLTAGAAQDAIVLIDAEDDILFWNSAAEKIFGFTAAEAIGRKMHELIMPANAHHHGFASGLAKFRRSGQGQVLGRNQEVLAVTKDGRELQIDLGVSAVEIDGRWHAIGLMRDITERKQAEAELVQYRDHLEELVEARTMELEIAKEAAEASSIAKSSFLANMSHEIRTPINAITGMAHLIRRAGVTPEQGQRLQKLETASAHLIEVINAILDLSKIEAGKFELVETAVNVNSFLGNVVSILQDKATAKGLKLAIETASLPETLLGDPTRLQQALLNYATNAVKFTDSGTITLRVKVDGETADSVLLRFEVEDTGIGMSSETMDKLFSAFEQGDNSATRKYGGTGLGLAITKKLANLMGGDAGAVSSVDQGSTFWFSARLKKGNGQQKAAKANDSEIIEAQLKARYFGRRVLVAEDEPINQEITCMLLEDVGLVPDVVSDGLQAVEAASSQTYDLILMDMQMPHMNGLDAARRIRALPNGAKMPILAVTANAFEEDKLSCFQAGMNEFIAKPIVAADFFASILKWLQQSENAA